MKYSHWKTTMCAAVLTLIGVPTSSYAQSSATAQALQADAQIIAQETGWPLSDTVDLLWAQDDLDALVDSLVANFSGDFSSAIFQEDPYSPSRIYFKAAPPTGALNLISSSGLNVIVYSNAGHNHIEWQDRVDDVADFLDLSGVTDYVVAFDSVGTIEVVVGGGAQVPTLPVGLSNGVVFSTDDGAVYEADTPVVANGQLVGGCSTAFTVRQIGSSARGILTAGHCTHIAQYRDTINNLTYGASPLGPIHFGSHGDFRAFSTTGAEVPRFASTPISDTPAKKIKNWHLIGQWVCVFGHATGSRKCSSVYRDHVTTSGRVTPTSPVVRVGRQIATKSRLTVRGDSGAGWSINTTVAGVHSGRATIRGTRRSLYSPVKFLSMAIPSLRIELAP